MQTNYDVIVIGGGASGMMASVFSARNSFSTLVLDHNEKLGKKLFITGKGKCNLTNNSSIETHLNNIITNSKFMISALNQFSPQDVMAFFEENGLFLDPVSFEKTDSDGFVVVELSKLESDSRVTFDQSLMLVNTEYMLISGFEPQLAEYKNTGVYMNSCMTEAYAELSAAVREIFGEKLYVSSWYRTAEEQEQLYLDDPDTATKVGASEHQTGLALDVYVAYFAGDAFIKSEEGRFVNSESWKYGFIIRYPSFGEDETGIRFEPWHIRYVGQPHANIIYNNHLTLEEYILSMKVGEWYESCGYLISRQPMSSDSLILPNDFDECIISPDNTGYYIVTVK